MPPEITFVHCQSFSRKPNRAGQCARQVIYEGLRSGGYHPHVRDPKPPVVVFGDPSRFQQMHDAHGNRARKQAMRAWQDGYHRAVGAPLGMHGDGPKRRRLSLAQWAAEQAMLGHHRALEEDRVSEEIATAMNRFLREEQVCSAAR